MLKSALVATLALTANTAFAGSVLRMDLGGGLSTFSGTDNNGDRVHGTMLDLGGGLFSQTWTDSNGDHHSGTGLDLGGGLTTFNGN